MKRQIINIPDDTTTTTATLPPQFACRCVASMLSTVLGRIDQPDGAAASTSPPQPYALHTIREAPHRGGYRGERAMRREPAGDRHR